MNRTTICFLLYFCTKRIRPTICSVMRVCVHAHARDVDDAINARCCCVYRLGDMSYVLSGSSSPIIRLPSYGGGVALVPQSQRNLVWKKIRFTAFKGVIVLYLCKMSMLTHCLPIHTATQYIYDQYESSSTPPSTSNALPRWEWRAWRL